MTEKLSYYITVAGLIGLGFAFPVWLNINTPNLGLVWAIVSGITVPGLLLLACANKTRNWSGITALCMIPFTVIGVMEIVATLGTPNAGMAIGVFAAVVFFSALDAGRRAQPQH